MTGNPPSLAQLKRALQLAEQIAQLQSEMNSIFGGRPLPSGVAASGGQANRGGRRKMSATALANIRAAQKKRWANFKSKGGAARGKGPAKKARKGGLTAAGRARLAAAMKARWAAARKSGGPVPTARKK
jgi:hypothetical protein